MKSAKLGYFLTLAFLAFSVWGCSGPPHDLMPLKSGEHWAYIIRNAQQSLVGDVKVNRRIAVAGANGWELSGPSGISRVVWKGSELSASMLSNTRYYPPIPLLDTAMVGKSTTWTGNVATPLHTFDAKAVIGWQQQSVQVGGKNIDSVQSTVQLNLSNGTQIKLMTWFAPNLGIVRQTQWSNGIQVLSMEHLSGP